MDIIYRFVVDFARPQRTNELLVMQNDHLTRTARFVLMDNGSPLDISDVDQVTINAILPDESRIKAEVSLATDEDGDPINEIIYQIPSSMTSMIGKTILSISLYHAADAEEDAELLTSFEFYLNTRNELNRDDYGDEDEYSGIRDLINRALEAVDLVDQLVARSVLPNPFPLIIDLENDTYSYDGSERVEVDFGTILSRIAALEQAFPDGCRIIADAIRGGRDGEGTGGIPTANDDDPPTTVAQNITDLAILNYNDGLRGATGEVPTWSTAFTDLTAGAQSSLETKNTKAGWTSLDTVVASTAAATTAQIDTTSDDQVHDIAVIPGVYNFAKVNQKPAYDAGYLDGFTDGVWAWINGSSVTFNKDVNGNVMRAQGHVAFGNQDHSPGQSESNGQSNVNFKVPKTREGKFLYQIQFRCVRTTQLGTNMGGSATNSYRVVDSDGQTVIASASNKNENINVNFGRTPYDTTDQVSGSLDIYLSGNATVTYETYTSNETWGEATGSVNAIAYYMDITQQGS